MNRGIKIGKLGLSCLGAIVLMAGCTRPGSSSNGITLELAIPQVASSQPLSRQERAKLKNFAELDSAFESTFVQVIILNVTGSGIVNPVYWQWQNSTHSSSTNPPTSVTLTVPSGNARTIQVLVVSQGVDTGLLSFNYGDTAVDLNGSDTTVSLTTAPLGGSNSGQGKIVGRYIDATGNGPTGVMNVLFTPPGKPSMLVQQGEIFGGYFEIFGLQGVGLTYAMASNGAVLFANASLGSLQSGNPLYSSVNPQASAMIYFPTKFGYNNCGGNGCTGSPQYEDQSQAEVVGYFGPGVSLNNNMVFSAVSTPMTLPQMYIDMNSDPMTWQTSPLVALGSPQAGLVSGGMQIASPSVLTSGTLGSAYQNYLYYNTSNSGDPGQALGITGPYALPAGSSSSSFLQFANAVAPDGSAGLQVNWQYAPGATVGLSASEVFYIPTSGSNNNGNQPYRDNSRDNAFLCSQLVSMGFKSAGQIPVGQAAQSVVISGQTMNSSLEVIVCPVASNGQYFETAVDGQPGNMGGGGNQLFLSWQAFGNGGLGYTLVKSASICQEYVVTLVNSAGVAQTASGDINLTFTDSLNQLMFYSDSTSCGNNSAPSSPVLSSGHSSVNVWVNSSQVASVGAIDAVSICPNCGNGNPGNGPFVQFQDFPFAVVANDSKSIQTSINFVNPSTGSFMPTEPMAVGTCYPVSLSLTDGNGSPLIYQGLSGSAPTFTLSSGATGSFFKDSNCTMSLPNNQVQFGATDAMDVIYFMPSVASTITISATVSAGVTIPPPSSVSTSAGSSQPSQVLISVGNFGYYHQQTCNPISFNVANSAGAVVFGSATINSLVFTNGSIYSVNPANMNGANTTDPLWCTTLGNLVPAGLVNVSIGNDANQSLLYFMVPAAGGGAVTMTEADSFHPTPTPIPIPSGDVYTAWAAMSAGPAYTQAQTTCVPYQVYLASASSNTPTSIPPGVTVPMTISTAPYNSLGLYSSSAACTAGQALGVTGQPYTFNVNLTSASPSATVYVSTMTYTGSFAAARSLNLSIVPSNSPFFVTSTSIPFNIVVNGGTPSYVNPILPTVPGGGGAPYLLVAGGPSPNYCYPLQVQISYSGEPIGVTAAGSATLSFAGFTGGSYSLYSNPMCFGAPLGTPSVPFVPGDSVEVVYLKINAPTSGTIGASYSSLLNPMPLTVNAGDSNPVGMKLSMNQPYGDCYAFNMMGLNDNIGAMLMNPTFSSLSMSIVSGATGLFANTMGDPCSNAANGTSSYNVALTQSMNSTIVGPLPYIAPTAGATSIVVMNTFPTGSSYSGFVLGTSLFPTQGSSFVPVTMLSGSYAPPGVLQNSTYPSNTFNVPVNVCTPLTLYLSDTMNLPALSASAVTFNLVMSASLTGQFYSDASCGTVMPGAAGTYTGSLPAFQQNLTVYYKQSTTTGGYYYGVSFNPTSGGNITQSTLNMIVQ